MSDEPKTPDQPDPYATSDKPSPHAVSTATFYPDELAGTMIGPYKLLQLMGKGGMGAVWMAEQTEPVQRRVALKIIKGDLGGKEVLARFEAERQALAMMDHPNIAKVLDAGATADGRPYFVMELVKGIAFTKYCDQEHLTPKERLELFIPICNAVQHAHQKGIIHRDLKPLNVLIALYDGKPVPKVIDFGIAKAMHQKLTERTMVTEQGPIGTFYYMAPEQAEPNNLDIDTRADIYSLGVMLYEVLTGAPPLRAEAYLEMLRLVREVEPVKPSTKLSKSDELPAISARRKLEPKKLAGMVRGDLDWIVMKCLEKDRGRRYETANQVGQELERFLADEPVQAGPPSVGYRAKKFLRRNRGLVIAAGLVSVVLVGGIIGTSIGLVQAENARAGEARQRLQAQVNEIKAKNNEDRANDALANVKKQKEIIDDFAGRILIPKITEVHVLDYRAASSKRMFKKGYYSLSQADADLHVLIDRKIDLRRTIREINELGVDVKKHIEGKIEPFGASDPDPGVALVLTEVSLELLKLQRYADAEPILRECLEVACTREPDKSSTFNTKSMLGASLLGQKKYADAEPLLKEGYEGMKQREKTMPPEAKVRLTEALERLVQLYEEPDNPSKNPAEAERWRKELAARKAAQKEPKK